LENKNFLIVVGARPNFMKVAPLCEEFDKQGITYQIWNSGQHYDPELNAIFREQFGLKNVYTENIKCENKIESIQQIMNRFSNYIITQTRDLRNKFNAIIVVGDVDTTFACALVAKKTYTPLIHIEAGLRSFDHTMPEERNRITVDHLSDILFSSCQEGNQNLIKEDVTGKVYMVGNIMIDCLAKFVKVIKPKQYDKPHVVVTFHRPENVDTQKIYEIMSEIRSLSWNYKVIFPIHPRTLKRITDMKLESYLVNCQVTKPLGYLDFMAEVMNAHAIVTDSGGIQEETTYLGIPCFTVRNNTERNITITHGTNKLIKTMDILNNVLAAKKKPMLLPKFWDGKTAGRIVKILQEDL